jgi:hypothetical protein
MAFIYFIIIIFALIESRARIIEKMPMKKKDRDRNSWNRPVLNVAENAIHPFLREESAVINAEL